MQKVKIPVWFWIVSSVLLVWNLMGVMAFLGTYMMNSEMDEASRNLFENYPLWASIAYAFAVFGGFLGCVGLLMRKKWAKILFTLSLLGIVVQMTYNFFIAENMKVYGPGQLVMPVMVVVFGMFLIWLSNLGIKKKWLN